MKKKYLFSVPFLLFLISCFYGCAGMAASAEEYFDIGMAYYDLGKFEEAEKWLNRAKQSDRTMVASQYNLGRLAYEKRHYEEAVNYFEGILKKDPDNILALRAAAYTRIRMGDIEKAEKHYSRLLELVPESADDGYNHALVLFAMERYEKAEEILEQYPFALLDNMEVLLLFARIQGKQNKVEAIDNFSVWLSNHNDPKVRYEYALVLEHHEMFARALEELRLAQSEVTEESSIKRADITFALARVLLVAEADSPLGITEMNTAISEGFNDISAVESLTTNTKISASNRESLRGILNNMRRAETAAAEAAEAAAKAADEAASDADKEENPQELPLETDS